ncbi:Bud-site selection protein [Xylariales sp. PMI_506]|nr:Bud-site selection protein [Xylariales sp. PMI_506]
MVKRKRDEPRLQDNLQKWEKELVRGLKTAKGFERQRLSKRIREASSDPTKTERLEREVMVLKSLDLHQAAHQHLCSSLLKIKGIAASPNLPDFIKPVAKPTLTEEERTALHNVTSALCNRKQVKDIIDEAIMGTCIALRAPMPERKGKGKVKNGREEQENQPDDTEKGQATTSKLGKSVTEEKTAKTTKQAQASKKKQDSTKEDLDESSSWEGFGSEDEAAQDSGDEEKVFSKFAHMLGGDSDEDEDAGGASDDDQDMQDSRARSIRGPSDYFSGSSDGEGDDDDEDSQHSELDSDAETDEDLAEEEDESGEESEDSDDSTPPIKKAKTKTSAKAAAESASRGNSTFLPSLMGGYISGSESEASDIDVAPPVRKNRRGQKARQAIWEKKYKEKANHIKNQAQKGGPGRDQGWDPKRGAVGADDAGPWKKGIRNPFAKPPPAAEGVHPDRQANFGAQTNGKPDQRGGRAPGGGSGGDRPPQRRNEDNGDWRSQQRPMAATKSAPVPAPAPKPKPKPKRDDEGVLHPSWQAAKLAKEATQKVEFQGKKVVFD